MTHVGRGLFRLWIVATVLWEIWLAWDLIGEFNRGFTGWEFAITAVLVAILAPLAVLALGRALLWVATGFQRE